MIRSVCYLPDQDPRTDIPVKEYAGILKNPEALLSIQVANARKYIAM